MNDASSTAQDISRTSDGRTAMKEVVMAYLNKIFYNFPALAEENRGYLQSG
jgi:hypothetical protein